MKQITIPGTTTDTTPDNKPAMCVFGDENTGKTRFGCTAPHDEGMIGWIALDKNSKAAVDEFKKVEKLNHILINTHPMLSHKEAIKAALVEKPEETKTIYKKVIENIFKLATDYADHPGIESIVIDNASQMFDWILMAHFGRRNQIDMFQRGPANQDMIDLINALAGKNLVLICRSADIYKETGETDKVSGRKKTAATGKMKPEGYSKIGGFVSVTLELLAKRTKVESIEDKYQARVITCKGNTLMEGQLLDEYGIKGGSIGWDSVMMAVGL